MLIFNSLEEIELYYNEETNTYVFNTDIMFLFELNVDSHIIARNIQAWNVKALNINARNIEACNITALDINAQDIDALDINAQNITAKDIIYHAICFAYKYITCTSIKSRRDNHKHFVLDGEIIYKIKEKKKAKEMFEALGWKLVDNRDEIIYYTKTQGSAEYNLDFYLDDKTYYSCGTVKGHEIGYPLNAQEHLAIKKQMKELGWLE